MRFGCAFHRTATASLLLLIVACSHSRDKSTVGGTQTYYELDALVRKADAEFGRLPPVIRSDADLRSAQARYAETIRSFMGTSPQNRVPLDPIVLEEKVFDDHVRRTVEYAVEHGDRVSAYLLIPRHHPRAGAAVLALHQTVPQAKDEVVGISGNTDMAYGLELVRRGYVVLAPDSITAGGRVAPGATPYVTDAFDRAHPEWSAMGKMLWDHQRAVDYLQSLPEADPHRIGVIGHSLGGYNALFLSAFDSRIRAVAVSSAYARMQTDPRRANWSLANRFVHFARLWPYVQPGSSVPLPWDFQHVLTLIAPRPLFQSFGINDHEFGNIATVAQIARAVAPAYGRRRRDFQTVVFEGGHSFPPEVRARSYAFLDDHLSPAPPLRP